MERRQNNGRRCQIVQAFVLTITDDTERLACFLYMENYTDNQVRTQLGINRPKLAALKLKLAIELRQAGIRMRED